MKRISAKNLLALLAPSREYLAGRGLVLPQEANHPVDYETLASILVDPSPDRPKALIDGLYFVHEMSTSECMADLLDAAAPGVLDFEGAEPTPADVAVQVCLKDRDLLEARPLRIGFSFPARVRRGLTLAGPQCRFQFPTQPLAFALQPVDLFPQPLVFLLRPSAPSGSVRISHCQSAWRAGGIILIGHLLFSEGFLPVAAGSIPPRGLKVEFLANAAKAPHSFEQA